MRCLYRILAVLLTCGACAATAQTLAVYPRSLSATDSQYRYDYELLRLALAATRDSHGAYELRPSDEAMNQARAADELARGSGRVTIFVRSTSIDHERRLLPIRIPVDKGLVSYRLFLIRADSQARLDAVRTLDELQRFSVGSFVTWTDTQVLRHGGFDVVTGDNYDGLFHMLNARRFELFSRSVDEALRECDERRAELPDLAVENGLLLYFPHTRYFFVARNADGQRLAARVEAGLERLIRDGRFDAHFLQHKGALIERAKLKSRRIFRIDNPLLSPETPLARRELWYDPLR